MKNAKEVEIPLEPSMKLRDFDGELITMKKYLKRMDKLIYLMAIGPDITYVEKVLIESQGV